MADFDLAIPNLPVLLGQSIHEQAIAGATVEHGPATLQRTCATCPKLHGEGGTIGPDITGANRTNLDYILLNVLNPNGEVQDAYKMLVVTTRDGRTYSGSIAMETDRQLTLRVVGGLSTREVADAFFVAFRLPNHFRALFAEGVFNAAFVPMFSAFLVGQGRSQARIFAEQVLAFLLVIQLVLLVVFELIMPSFMLIFAPGFSDEPMKYDLAVLFTRITFPYLLFISLVSLMGAVLNSVERFAAAAAAPPAAA